MTRQLDHLVNIGRKLFAIATERGATVVSGNADAIRAYIEVNDVSNLYLHTQ